ncbi:MAG: long-chain fatty acid--CoA ligase, partial [Desulfofustis sp.]
GQDRKGFAALLVSDHEEFKGRVEETFFSLRRETIERLTNNQVLEQIRKEINTRLKPKKGFKAHERQLSTAFLKKDLKSGEELTNTLKRKQHILERNERTRINQLFQ